MVTLYVLQALEKLLQRVSKLTGPVGGVNAAARVVQRDRIDSLILHMTTRRFQWIVPEICGNTRCFQ